MASNDMKGHYWTEAGHQSISDDAYAVARALVKDGFISTSNKYRSVSRPLGDFSKYGYEWHARVSGETQDLDVETYTAFREVAPCRCRQCGQIEGHSEGCKTQAQDLQTENVQLRSKLAAMCKELSMVTAELTAANENWQHCQARIQELEQQLGILHEAYDEAIKRINSNLHANIDALESELHND